MTRRTWLVIAAGLLVALFAAGFLSFYASSSPDGLEKVADDKGFLQNAQTSAMSTLPTADYQIAGIQNAHLSVGLAGVTGVLIMIVLGFGLFWLIARGKRSSETGDGIHTNA